MKEQELEYLRSPALGTVVKSALLGFVLGEFFYVFFEFGKSIRDRFSHSSSLLEIVLFEGALYTSLIVFSVLRYLRPAFARGIRSKRVDLLIGVALGCLGAIAFPNPVSVQYQSFFDSLTSFQIGITFAIPLCIGLTLLISALVNSCWNRRPKGTSFFVSDSEKKSSEDDLLDVAPIAARVSERVLNGESSESIVFGLDAPWGAGKSTFINFCVQNWMAKQNPPIVFRFNPIQYEDRAHLLNKFIDGLVLTLRENMFLPELRTIISRYSKLIAGKRSFNFGGFEFDFTQPGITVERAADDVRYALSRIDRRLIIIVDDLDRMEFQSLKDMLFVIKKGFFLPNVSFLLCYDSQNIAALEGGSY